MQKLIAQGAEAKLFLEKEGILKNRFKKSYRIKEIDDKLRGFRTRREAKILDKLQAINFPAPKLKSNDEKENLILEKIDGKLVKDVLENHDYKKLCAEIGRKVAILHNNTIIHGDLTTSNMIFNKEIYFIDFDLYLLKEGLESKHYKIWEECFKCVLETYKKEAKNSHQTLKRLEAVEKRGRYRAKKGS